MTKPPSGGFFSPKQSYRQWVHLVRTCGYSIRYMSDYDPTDLVGQKNAQAKREEDASAEKKNVSHDFKRLLGTDWGRRVVWKMLTDVGVFRTSFRLNNEMAYLEGRRSVGLDLLSLANEVSPENYILMLEEARKK